MCSLVHNGYTQKRIHELKKAERYDNFSQYYHSLHKRINELNLF